MLPTGYEENLRSCKGLARCHLVIKSSIRHFAFETGGKVRRDHVITCCILIRKKIKNLTRNRRKNGINIKNIERI